MKSASLKKMALVASVAGFASMVHAGEVRVMCYQDGVECDVTAELAKRFEASHPGTKIIVDAVPYKTIVEQLPVQLADHESGAIHGRRHLECV